jgi:hypothetical protein
MISVLQEVKTNGAGFGTAGPDAVPACLSGVGGDQFFQLGLGSLMLAKSRAGAAVNAGKFGS